MNNRGIKIMLVVSLAFNLSVLGTLAVGKAMRSVTERRAERAGSYSKDTFEVKSTRLAKCIGLSGEKTKKFSELLSQSTDEEKALRKELASAREGLVVLLHENNPDEAVVMGKVDEISLLQGELEKRLVKRVLRSREILTDEENEKLLNLIRCSMRPGCCPKRDDCPVRNETRGRKKI